MRNLKTALEELDVKYSMPVQPIVMPQGPPPHDGGRSPRMQAPRMQQPPMGQGFSSGGNLGNAGGFGPSRGPVRAMGDDAGGM